MPKLPPKACSRPGCPKYATNRGYCEDHQRPAWEKGSRSRSGGYGWRWTKLRRQVLERDGYLCQPCLKVGRLTRATEVDHVLNIAAGGTDSPDNLRAICTQCHRAKTRREASQGAGVSEK